MMSATEPDTYELAIHAANDAVGELHSGCKPGTRDIKVAVDAYEAALWQPIETILKKGEVVLAVGHYRDDDEVFTLPVRWYPHFYRDDGYLIVIGASGPMDFVATHWRPLPSAPVSAA